jgi:hypothetical protein
MGFYTPFQDVNLHPVPERETYGLSFPEGVNQLIIELACFKLGRSKQSKFYSTRFNHLINIVRMLWDEKDIRLSRIRNNVRIWDTYTLNTLHKLCDGKNVCLTGPASSGKTYASAIYGLVSFYASPIDSTVLISTTSSGGSERRVFGKLKMLHSAARFDRWFPKVGKEEPSIGKLFDYLKCITFNADAEILGQRATVKNLTNGVIVIPIAQDSTGENALDTIMGTKGHYVYWIVDEMPAMMHGVMRPRSNLIHNPFFQFIGLGNAADKNDPHGLACEPLAGWDTIDPVIDRDWQGKTVDVLFLNGEESPNDHPSIDQSTIIEATDYPFPYLSNRVSRNETAIFEGNGDLEEGKKTLGYNRFAIGFWPGDDVRDTILSASFVKRYNADQEPLPWGPGGYDTFWGLDPAYTSGGDDNALFYIQVGQDINGSMQVAFQPSAFVIKPMTSNKEDFRFLVAQRVLEMNKKWHASTDKGCMDAMADGALLYREFVKLTGKSDIVPLSSMGKSNNARYKNLVTEYWFNVQELIATGYCRGFNIQSLYARDLFMRRYEQAGKTVAVETKDEMKKRLRRSPDHGDCVAYTCHLVKSRVRFSARVMDDKRRDSSLSRYYVQEEKQESVFSGADLKYGDLVY